MNRDNWDVKENITNKQKYKMRQEIKSITVIAGDYPAEGHHMLVFVQQLVHAIIDMGVKVTVVAPQSVTHAMTHHVPLLPKYSVGKTENGIEYVIYRPYSISLGNNAFLRKLFGKFTTWFNRIAVTSRVRRIKSDILYTHFWSNSLLVYKYALKKELPLFVACGEGDNALESMVDRLSKKDLQYLKSSVTGVVSVSSENRRKCINFNLCNESNVDVFPNCVNTTIFHKMDVDDMKKQLGINDEDFVIGFVGGFIPRKGPDRIAKAITKLDDPQIKVMFIGKPFSGYDYDFDCPGIIHKGPLAHDLLPRYINCADVFVMPTQKEGCCNAIVEALAMGLPVISSDGAFNDDILDEKNSIRLNPNDVNAIAAAIKELKTNADLRKSMQEYSLSRHDEYSIKGRAARIIEFINSQVNTKLKR